MTSVLRFIVISCCLLDGLIWGWLFGSPSTKHEFEREAEDDLLEGTSSAAVDRRRIPFEIKTMDDRFLLEAAIARDMSPLDACHHRVVAELEGTCGGISEEEMAKLSVRLLNCQLEVEKRRTYQCTSDMALAECTSDMDATTWNSYQIVSNRARAICYAVRQQQFQLNAELTVNRLVESSQQQLQTLNTLYHGQEQIRSVAENTVAQMELGQKRLAENQEQLERVQADIRIRVVGNLLELRREKELIAAKNRELLGLTEDIRQKLDLTAAGISDQSAVHSARHQELLGDLANLKSRADDVSTKLDKSAAAADSFQRDMIGHHVHALDNLRRINETINYLLTLASGLTDVIDSRSEWLLRITGATDDRMLVLTVVVLHFVYFLAVLFMLAVLRFSFLVRWFLLALVCVNAAAEIKLGKSLTLSELSVAVAVIAVGDLVFLAVRRRWLKGTSKSVVGCGGSANWDGEQHQSLLYADIQHIIKALESLRADICSGHSSSSEPLVDSPVSVAERLDTRLPDVLKNRLDESSFSAGRRSPPPVHRTVFPGMSALTSSPSVSAAYRDLPTGIDTTVTSLTRTHLIRSFAAGSRTPSSRRGGSPAPSDSSYSSTPSKQRPGSRASNLNQSGSRPLCEAFTKTGQPCKLQCQEESKFCYRHQPVSAD